MTIASLIVSIQTNHQAIIAEVQKINTALDSITGMAGKVGAALGIGFGVYQIVGFVKHVFEAADELEKLKDKTGINVEALQRLQAIGDAAGNTIEEMTSAINKMQKRLAGGDDSAIRAFEELHLSISQLRRMEPDQQFMAIARAIVTIKDPADQVRLAVALFGKTGAEVLPSLKANVDQLSSGVITMSAHSSKALDDFSDALARAWRNTKNLAGEIFGQLLSPRAPEAGVMVEPFATLEDLIAKAKGPGLGLPTLPLAVASPAVAVELNRAYEELNGTIREQADALRKAAEEQEKLEAHYRSFTNFIEERRIDDAKAQLEMMTKSTAALTEEFHQLQALLRSEPLGELPSVLKTENAAMLQAAAHVQALTDEWRQLQGLLASGTIAKMGDLPAALTNELKNASTALDKLRGGFGSFVSGITSGLKSVWQGMSGGKGISGLLGTIGTGLAEGFGHALSKGLTGAIDFAAGLAMQGLGKLFEKTKGWIFGPLGAGLKALFGQSEGQKTNDLRDQFLSAAGGLDVLAAKALAAGTNVEALLHANKVKDFEDAVTALQTKLGAFANEQAADAERLTAAIQRYGFSFEELGPKLQNQRLHEQATELIEDWRVLVGAGIDIDTVSTKMSSSMNDYLHLALKTGAEVPAALRPILEHMVNLGVLTDVSGAKVTDLGLLNITWSESMTAGFDRVVAKLQQLIDSLQRTGSAISSIPRNVNVDVVERHRRVIEEVIERQNPEDRWHEMHVGGIIRAHSGLAVDERMIIAQTGEGILSRRGMRSLGELNAGHVPRRDTDDAIRREVAALRADMRRASTDAPRSMAVAVRDALVLAGVV
ncbi:MAG TPA: hypothetical protein VGJ39_03990 [Vicinamibacterales bacterium]